MEERGEQRGRHPGASLSIMHAAFSFPYAAAEDTKKSAALLVCESPLAGASNAAQATADT